MARKSTNPKIQSVRTTVLSIDWQNIDWSTVDHSFYVVRYDLPQSMTGPGTFGKMHNWFRNISERPYYLHTYGPHLYVKYESSSSIEQLAYSQLKLPYSIVDIRQETTAFHAVFKTLVSDYFQTYEKFASNAHFFLQVSPTDRNYIVVLKIQFKQDWQHNHLNDFIVTAEATRLRKLSVSEINDLQDWSREIYYGRIYQGNEAYFKQLKTEAISDIQKREGIFVEYRNPQNRASVPFHSVKSVRDLEKSRSFLLNKLIANLAKHFTRLGFPCRQKRYEMEQVHTKMGPQMTRRQLPRSARTIYVVDGRIRPTMRQDHFADQFCRLATRLFQNDLLSFEKADANMLNTGDWVLRIQDYDVDDLRPGNILQGYTDNKNEFYSSYSQLVKQTLNINPKSDDYHDELKKPEKEQKIWSIEDYFNYSIDQLMEEQDELLQNLTVCHNQLFLKDVVQFPNQLSARFPMIEALKGKVFMAYGALVYYDDDSLHFARIDNDQLESSSETLYKLTGKRLIEDILDRSRNQNYFQPDAPKRFEDVKKRKFIISHDYVLEIVDSEIRILYEDQEIQNRLQKQEQTLAKDYFYPDLTVLDPPIFTRTQLQQFADFLDDQVIETHISYKDLKTRYGKEIKNRAEQELDTTKGFYSILGITKDAKLKQYYEQCRGLVFESSRDQTVIPVYQGIWYEPDLQLYLVGSKDSAALNQERGFVYREVQCHDWQQGKGSLKNFLQEEIFPLLEVNFIRHNNYTVYPYPFKLIQIWQELEQRNLTS